MRTNLFYSSFLSLLSLLIMIYLLSACQKNENNDNGLVSGNVHSDGNIVSSNGTLANMPLNLEVKNIRSISCSYNGNNFYGGGQVGYGQYPFPQCMDVTINGQLMPVPITQYANNMSGQVGVNNFLVQTEFNCVNNDCTEAYLLITFTSNNNYFGNTPNMSGFYNTKQIALRIQRASTNFVYAQKKVIDNTGQPQSLPYFIPSL